MQKLSLRLGLIAAIAMAVSLAGSNRADARPGYLKAFASKYSKLAAQAKKAKCGVCHYGKSKKNRNDYGKALSKHTGKNQKDAAKVAEALDATAKEKNAKGVTFGSLIEAGKLPGTNPE
jgi:hypothetical protein